jgi:poly-gamma-glutamate synthesis protein (capsule biosynthesis protein)
LLSDRIFVRRDIFFRIHMGSFITPKWLFALVLASSSALAQSPGNEITLLFGGDCLPAGHYEQSVGEDIHRGFRDLTILQEADVTMVNLECPVTTRGTKIPKPYNFRMKPEFLHAITESGIDIVNIANNHIYDYDSTGLYDTIHYLDSAGIHHTGAGRNKSEAHEPVLLEVRGRRVAFLGYYGGGEAPAATASGSGVARRALPAILEDIAAARKKRDADIVVINLHWGVEKAALPDPEQVEFARNIVSGGADLVIGHHPHVLQPVERFKTGIIAYSLGNLLFGGNSRSSYDTAMLEVRIDGETMEYSVIPVRVKDWSATVLEGPEGMELARLVTHMRIPEVKP